MNISIIHLSHDIRMLPISCAYHTEDVGTILSILFFYWIVYEVRADEVRKVLSED